MTPDSSQASALRGTVTASEVLNFWFGSDELQAMPDIASRNRWFQKSDEFDQQIRKHFGATVEAAQAGELDHWRESSRGELALILLCDQFSRNIFRGRPTAFAGDPLALDIGQTIVRENRQGEFGLHQRAFVGMPLEHSESGEIQAQSVAYFDQLRQAFSGPGVNDSEIQAAEGYYRFAVAHKAVIDEFGRYPHRNKALGRDTSVAEQAWLNNGGGF
ncbi:DUF924 domain-containing protein [Microbulbifer sp. CAU 1566]|uniref:DUF924 family protein n=1 Tax=Microbulbifer sp. CAU 1566 TaxID=2933269 RepID=UPI002005E0FC|nr:DUF924 family protein [Microbulbifer sp. CAU 1566]MCK7597045.1 DUF924 domain-containing protein [Microbulbifer sp. CAU 1566]